MLKKPNGKTGAEQRDFVAYPLSLLPADAVESAFAITIHKSQGSEYDHVTMFLPKEEGHPLLNNQILYTGITRAKKTVTIIATDKTFKAACETVIERDTGIEI
jgi:exodeoxyribonuclease V alpha subunit